MRENRPAPKLAPNMRNPESRDDAENFWWSRIRMSRCSAASGRRS